MSDTHEVDELRAEIMRLSGAKKQALAGWDSEVQLAAGLHKQIAKLTEQETANKAIIRTLREVIETLCEAMVSR